MPSFSAQHSSKKLQQPSCGPNSSSTINLSNYDLLLNRSVGKESSQRAAAGQKSCQKEPQSSTGKVSIIRNNKKLIDYQDRLIQSVLSNTSASIHPNMSGGMSFLDRSHQNLNDSRHNERNHENSSVNAKINKNKLYSSFDEFKESFSRRVDETNNDEDITDDSTEEIAHPAKILATRPDYYTIPSMDVLASMTESDGSCKVKNFVIGREKFGSLMFPGITDVSNLNIDRDVHFK